MRGRLILLVLFAFAICPLAGSAQSPTPKQHVRTVTIPISIFTEKELKENQAEEFVSADRLIVREDKDEQEILSIRSAGTAPLSIAFVIQEDLSTNFNLQIKDLQTFIRALPRGTRVMTAYLRAGSTQVPQRFTDDLERAARSLRIVSGNSAFAPRSPYDGVDEVLGRFDAVPAGRRAILLFSDGLDTSEGLNLASITQSFSLERSVKKAQRKSVAIYSFYSPTARTDNSSVLSLGGQGALEKISDETGGRAYTRGSIAPLSYVPFFKELIVALNRQFSLTYLSTHMNKGYHKVQVQSTNPEIRIDHPKGYYHK